MNQFSSPAFHDLSDGTIKIPFSEPFENSQGFVMKIEVIKKFSKNGPKFFKFTALLPGENVVDSFYIVKRKAQLKVW